MLAQAFFVDLSSKIIQGVAHSFTKWGINLFMSGPKKYFYNHLVIAPLKDGFLCYLTPPSQTPIIQSYIELPRPVSICGPSP